MLGSNALTRRAALLTKRVYGDRGSTCSGSPMTGGPPRSTCPRIGGPGVHQSGGSTVPPTPAACPATAEPMLTLLIIHYSFAKTDAHVHSLH